MKTLLATTTLALCVPALSADELHREWIDPGAQVVLHFDWEGLQKTELWKQVREDEDNEVDVNLDEFMDEFGLDLKKEVRSVSFYSMSLDTDSEKDAVILVSTTEALDQALVRAAKEEEYGTLSHGGLDLHSFGKGDDAMVGYVHSTGTGRVMVLSASAERVATAARIVRGESASHARAEVPRLDLTPGPGSFLFLAAKGLSDLDGFAPASRIFGMTSGVRLDVGESQGSLMAHLAAVTASPEDATNVADVLRGLKGMANLAAGDHGELVEFAQAIRINTRGAEVLLDFEFDILNLIDNLEVLEEDF